ncbi:MAG: ubiquinone biosynthesis regulatory protein kinase UbiB [Gammaproteobacteria bacterium]
MLGIAQLWRLLMIQRVFLRNDLDELVFAMPLFQPIRWLRYLLPWNWFRSRRLEPGAVRIRRTLEALGPVAIKFGQLLSTRRDMLPEDIAIELAKLQDKVPPFPGTEAKHIVENAFHKKIDDIFLSFDETPLASASIAQVHAATLKDGREMIVKVVRPDIEKVMRRDVSIMHRLARTLERHSDQARNLRPTSVVQEFEKNLLDELDLMREAANASQLRRNFSDSDILYIPQVEWEYTTANVMLMEKVSGIHISDVAALDAAGIDLQWLAESIVELFFTQVFRDSYFHADMHPGNIFINPGTAGKPRIAMVDFGIMSSLSEFDQRYLAGNFIAFLNRDYRKVAQLHLDSGWVPDSTRVDEFEFAVRTVCEPLFDRPLKEISYATMLLRLFQTARRFNMVILPQLVLLQKTLLNIEGLGRELYPELDLWRTARPIMERWMSGRMGLRGLLKGVGGNVPYWLDRLPEAPGKALDLLDRLHNGKLAAEVKSAGLDDLRDELQRYNRNNVLVITGAALIIAGILISPLDTTTSRILGMPLSSLIVSSAGLFLIVRVLLRLNK